MDPDKTFCLKWNNFQQNIFATIRNLRLDLDFLDVTIFCKGKQVKAHKVILSACSNTFKAILKETQAAHPVIVLWDVEARDLAALLDFMYNGQVDIQQDDLERFLIVAERLQVRGLSGEESNNSSPERGRKRQFDTGLNNAFKPAKVVRKEGIKETNSNEQHIVINNSGGGERESVGSFSNSVGIKTETEEGGKVGVTASPASVPTPAPRRRDLNSTDTDPAEYNTEPVDYPETMEYPVEPSETYEDFYDEDNPYNNSAQYPIDYSIDNSPGKGGSSKSVQCPYCEKVLKYRHNLKGHIQNQHGAGEPEAPCPICPDKIFKNSASLRDHMSRKHRAEKAGGGGQVGFTLATPLAPAQQQLTPQVALSSPQKVLSPRDLVSVQHDKTASPQTEGQL